MIYLEKSPAHGTNRRLGTGLLSVLAQKRGISGTPASIITLAKMPNHNLVMDKEGFETLIKRVGPSLFAYDDNGAEVLDKATRTRLATELLRRIVDRMELPEGEG